MYLNILTFCLTVYPTFYLTCYLTHSDILSELGDLARRSRDEETEKEGGGQAYIKSRDPRLASGKTKQDTTVLPSNYLPGATVLCFVQRIMDMNRQQQ